MKKGFSYKVLILSVLSLVTLSSCSIARALIAAINEAMNSGGDYVYTENSISLSLTHNEGKAGTNTTLKEVKKEQNISIFPSLGEQNLLVIPVYFKDYTPESVISVGRDKAKENIYTAFFGEANNTGWESLASFYSKSSYGQLTIKGEVSDWCPLSTTLYETAKDETYSDCTIGPLREAISWYKTNYPDTIQNYDNDKDGIIDGVVLVYANAYYSNSNANKYNFFGISKNIQNSIKDMCWAFTTWDKNSTPDVESPTANVYMWASYDFLWDGGYTTNKMFNAEKLVDAHTYIHEFGHMLGLDDYYSYDTDDTAPVGGLDMMDNNIGDHDAYSKYLLGWLEPNLITEPGSYELDALQDKPMALLVPKSKEDFAYSAFDEYLLIELYTPTGLNSLDSRESYCNSYPRLFTSYGVKILHVDSRLVVFDMINKTYSFSKICPPLQNGQKLSFYSSNTPSESCDANCKLITLLSRGRINDYYKTNGHATNDDLFVRGTSLSKFKYNTGESLNFDISVNQIDVGNRKAVITFSEK